ncbi:MAG: SycD/LcrH family type III secretion system chaperone [Gammaproteobacteria bacterium]|nr:SycD/LcrH family type III secretion system chaperone [Gammaproteobacteria bacterium]MDE0273955.1 SycD/LcrH family type III secretion system chaperone [Gammaproteobacteria bacterium]
MPDPFEAITDEQLQTVEELATKCLLEGATLGAVRGYSSDELEAVYGLAHNAYRQRKYEQAVKLFLFLVENDHAEHRFWMGLAATYQMSEQYRKALVAFGMTTFLDATNPWPSIHACECYLALGERENARLALDGAEGVCEATDHKQSNGDARARIEKIERQFAQTKSSPSARPVADGSEHVAPPERFNADPRPVRGGVRRTRRRV